MAEHYRFFDSIDGGDERYYTADEFAEYFRQLLTSGIFNGGENLRVTTTGVDMNIMIQPGYAWLEGYLYKIDTEPLVLTLDAADPNLDRIDRVVIRLDKRLENRYVKAFILKGEPAEEPEVPELTRDENIYEISLAQIKVLGGKSFIGEAEVLDERFDESVCGIVNSLIKIDTSHLIKAFEGEWQTWFNAIKDETFVPIGNLRDGFIRTPSDLIYSTPDSKLQIEKGWPIHRNIPKMELEGLGLNEDGNLYINTLKNDYEDVFSHNVEGNLSSENLHADSQLAIPFTVNTDVKHLQITMILKRYSIGMIRCIICGSDDEGLPDLTKEIGRYFPDWREYSAMSETFTEFTWDMALNRLLKTDEQYYVILYSWSIEYYINAAYSDSPGEVNYFLSTNQGSTWTSYERTPHVIISGKELIDEGVATIDYSNVANFIKHGLINLEITENVNSYYVIDVLDLNGNVIKGNIIPGKYLFKDNLSKDTKVRIKLIKVGEEEPKLKNYEHLWVADISTVRIEQAIVPSESTILYYPSAKTGPATIYAHISEGGRYRLKCEIKTNNATVNAFITIYENNSSYGNRIGYASVTGDVYTPVTIDLDSVAPNSKIAIALTTSSSSNPPSIRYIEICGEYGYQKIELTGI
jgi:hypothetical protein